PAAAGRGGRGGGGGVGGGIMLSADPSSEGRYAIARQAGSTMMVSITDDGGRTWRPPVLAAELPRGATGFGHRALKYSPRDDLSSIEVDGQFVYAVWGDNRSGFLGTWYGRVPLTAY